RRQPDGGARARQRRAGLEPGGRLRALRRAVRHRVLTALGVQRPVTGGPGLWPRSVTLRARQSQPRRPGPGARRPGLLFWAYRRGRRPARRLRGSPQRVTVARKSLEPLRSFNGLAKDGVVEGVATRPTSTLPSGPVGGRCGGVPRRPATSSERLGRRRE